MPTEEDDENTGDAPDNAPWGTNAVPHAGMEHAMKTGLSSRCRGPALKKSGKIEKQDGEGGRRWDEQNLPLDSVGSKNFQCN